MQLTGLPSGRGHDRETERVWRPQEVTETFEGNISRNSDEQYFQLIALLSLVVAVVIFF